MIKARQATDWELDSQHQTEFLKEETKENIKNMKGKSNLHPIFESILFDKLPLNRKTLSLANFIDNGGRIPPIKVKISDKGGYQLKDGRHRLAACKLTGQVWIEAIICIELKNKPLT